ncbi:glutamate racemase [Desulfolutivibrio sulfoxidireducens]|uniref:glutamate racemase n=1 Tax=Desulfolutivibrio sulfoxidireducens TaxID=2773299 RepID=UPI0021094F42|nr:glutamate racemase [Desulfolutivibrio sulfoxidireducens]
MCPPDAATRNPGTRHREFTSQGWLFVGNETQHPIGIFDSGVGGLTVTRAVMELLPHERIVYFGDTARVPYGVKSPGTISRYASEIVRFLLEKDVKLLIVACNTMAAVALPAITALSPVPVLEVIDAGAKSALAATRTGRIGIIATPSTVHSGAYPAAIARRGGDAALTVSRACPLFVPLAEEGFLDHPATRLIAREYLAPVLAENPDTLILGCTHYPLLRPLLQDVAGPGVTLVDSATAVAADAARVLAETGLLTAPDEARPAHAFFVTDAPDRLRGIGELFLGRPLPDVHLVSLGC